MAFPANEAYLHHLETELDHFGVDPKEWRSGKTPSDLLEELRAGESRLVLARMLRVVKMRVLRETVAGKQQRLVELGKRRNGKETLYDDPRDPSGKVANSETTESAFQRELKEELGLNEDDYGAECLPLTVEHQVEESKSYPGILGIYELHWFQVKVGYMCLERFWVESSRRYEIPDGGDKGTTLYFAWEPIFTGH